jgi:uncharacterized Zn finger protein
MRLTDLHIERLIEERYRQRGRQYFLQGLVELTSVTNAKVTAKCAGTKLYKVRLELQDGKLQGACSCPAFEDFGPCKHIAATCYATMAKCRQGYAPSEEYQERKEELGRLERYLTRKSKSELVMLVLQMIQEEPELQWMFEGEMEE